MALSGQQSRSPLTLAEFGEVGIRAGAAGGQGGALETAGDIGPVLW